MLTFKFNYISYNFVNVMWLQFSMLGFNIFRRVESYCSCHGRSVGFPPKAKAIGNQGQLMENRLNWKVSLNFCPIWILSLINGIIVGVINQLKDHIQYGHKYVQSALELCGRSSLTWNPMAHVKQRNWIRFEPTHFHEEMSLAWFVTRWATT